MKVYVSGQIKGLDEDYARARFARASEMIVKAGSVPVNPFEIEETHEPASRGDWNACMVIDIKHLFECDAIFMLDNWKVSKGARIEHAIAVEMGIPIDYQ